MDAGLVFGRVNVDAAARFGLHPLLAVAGQAVLVLSSAGILLGAMRRGSWRQPKRREENQKLCLWPFHPCCAPAARFRASIASLLSAAILVRGPPGPSGLTPPAPESYDTLCSRW